MAELFFDQQHEPVEANQITPENVDAVALWCAGVAVVEHDAFRHEVTFAAINVPSMGETVRAQEGDWVVRAPEGFFYVVKDTLFKTIFTAVK